METLTADQFKKKYGQQGVEKFKVGQTINANQFNQAYGVQSKKTIKSPSVIDKLIGIGKDYNYGQIGIGTLKGTVSTILGTRELLERTASYVGGGGFKTLAEQTGTTDYLAKIKESIKPTTGGQKIGFYGEQLGEFFVPGGASTKAEKFITSSKILSQSPKAKSLIGLGTKALTEAGLFGGQTAIQQGTINEETKQATILGGTFPIVGKTFSFLNRAAQPVKQGFSSKLINSLIKPSAKYFEYGKNAGRGVAREGITFNTFEKGIEKISTRLNEIGQKISLGVSNYKNKYTILPNLLSPIDDAISKLSKAPETNASAINRLQGTKNDAKNYLNNLISDSNFINSESLWNFNKFIGELAKFTGNPSDDKIINSAIKQVYGKTKNELNKITQGTIIGLKERYADLLTAKIVMEQRTNVIAGQNIVKFIPKMIGAGGIIAGAASFNPITIAGSLAYFGVDKLFSSAIFKTNLAKWLYKASNVEREELMMSVPILRNTLERIFGKNEKINIKQIFKGLDDFKPAGLLPSGKTIFQPEKTGSTIQKEIQSSGMLPQPSIPYSKVEPPTSLLSKK